MTELLRGTEKTQMLLDASPHSHSVIRGTIKHFVLFSQKATAPL